MKDDQNREQFLSCDWGTSSFRLRLIDAKDESILSEIKTHDGIANIFQNWKQTGKNDEERKQFYLAFLFEHVKRLKASHGIADEMRVVLSGMASSSIGMIELPYKKLPFHCNGSDLIIHEEKYDKHLVIIISGACSQNDVMRGEETMLAGCDISNDNRDEVFIFPGTHSKHIVVNNGIAESFATYMTGEMFDLLSHKSILLASVQKESLNQNDNEFFKKGVLEGVTSNLLNSIFHVRTNQLLKKATSAENYHYLSGLLIGYELKAIAEKKPSAITLVCNGNLKGLYLSALETVDLKDIQCVNADEALINGQRKILKRKNSLQY